MESKPTHEQAQLHLQVYDLRREARLRQARDWFQQNYRAETLEDAMRTRLYPEMPPHRYICFYPMDRKRGELKNPGDEVQPGWLTILSGGLPITINATCCDAARASMA